MMQKQYERLLFEKTVIGLALCRMNGELVDVNPAYAAIIGRSIEETLTLSYWQITPKKYQQQEQEQLESILETGKYGPYEKEYIHADGHMVPVRLSGQVVERDGESYIWSSVEDITDFKQAEKARTESENRLNNFFQATFETICLHDQGIILDVNPAITAAFGYQPEEILGRNLIEFVAPESVAEVTENMLANASGPYEATVIAKSGDRANISVQAKSITLTNGKTVHVAGLRDITERKKAESQLEHLALHDNLTGLPNRLHFLANLGQALETARLHQNKVALLFLDLDGFKYVNDTLGHNIGDQLLVNISGRLKEYIRGSDTVARLGGDEFIILLTGINHPGNVEEIARELVKLVSRPMSIEENTLSISTSIGISLFPDHATHEEELIKSADSAMYHAKTHGKNSYQFFNPGIASEMIENVLLRTDLQKALENQQLELHYQPLFNLADGQISGLEALIRWNHPQHGLLYPESFLAVIDELNLGDRLTQWVLETIAADHQHWKAITDQPLRLSINIGGNQLLRKESVEQILNTSRQAGLLSKNVKLVIEVIENDIKDTRKTIQMIRRLKANGISVSIGNFGIGYSSLSRLKHLPVDSLKIDRSFINNITLNRKDRVITQAIINMAQHLDLKIIGVGVESRGQLDTLREMGCDEIQGFYFVKPVPAQHIANLLKQQWQQTDRPQPA